MSDPGILEVLRRARTVIADDCISFSTYRILLADIDAALRAHEAAAKGSGWLPISKAPKDGNWVLTLSWPYSTIPTALHWDGPLSRWWDDAPELEGVNIEWQPTHWMPLPAPPSPNP